MIVKSLCFGAIGIGALLTVSKCVDTHSNTLSCFPYIKRVVKYVLPKQKRDLIEKPKTCFPMNDLVQSALLSRLAYETPGELRKKAKEGIMGFKLNDQILAMIDENNPIYIESLEDAQVYIWKLPNNVVAVSFRGTSSTKDALADIDIRQHHLGGGKWVHAGFWRQFDSIKLQITEVIKDLPFDKLLVNGHSLGGGLSTLTAFYFASLYPEKYVQCLTYGSPRVGNNKFTEYFNACVKDSFRVYNQEDVVSMIPITHRFEHVTNGICISDDEKCWLVPKDLVWYMRPFVHGTNIDYFQPIADHDCTLYITRLSNLSK